MGSLNVDELTKHFLEDGIGFIHEYLEECKSDGKQRLTALESIRTAIDATYIDDQTLDKMREIYEACILESLNIADGDQRIIQHANVLSYNLSANLADCWDDAVEARTVEHFNAGVVAANRCLDLRRELNKPPAAMAMAYFILGVHEYSLKHYAEAESAWSKKLENEYVEYQNPSEAESDLNVMLSHGLLGLARWSLGNENGDNYRASIRSIESARTAENGQDVDLFVSELTLLKDRHAPADLS